MEREGKRRLARGFHGAVRIHCSLDMRYGEQIFEINMPLEDLDLASPGVMQEVVERFHQRHDELYTYSMRDQEVLLVNARVAVTGALPEHAEGAGTAGASAGRPASQRRVYLNRWQEVPVFDLEKLAAGQTIAGPAIIEAATTTVLLRGRECATITPMGWIDIRLS